MASFSPSPTAPLRNSSARPILSGMQPSPSPRVVQIGEYLFDRSTGEVRKVVGTGETRLAPQPARLLELLIEKGGELATHDEIRARLWPETHVDFEPSLHFCVRQIRAAFADSASVPGYIETLPRRGYRLAVRVVAVEALESEQSGSTGRPSGVGGEHGGSRRWVLRSAVGAGLIVVAVLTFQLAARPAATGAPVRLAIMPFELAAEGERGADLAQISEWLVAELGGDVDGGIEVVGPRSTGAFSSFPFPDLDRMSGELQVDHVLNARLLERDGETQLIIELIRLSDRAHPWVELYEDPSDWRAIAREVSDGVRTVLRPSS